MKNASSFFPFAARHNYYKMHYVVQTLTVALYIVCSLLHFRINFSLLSILTLNDFE